MNGSNIIKEFIANAIREDIGDGDHTTLSTISVDKMGKAQLLVKEDGIIAGIEIAIEVFREFDNELKVTTLLKDGDTIKVGDVAFYVEGKVQSILICERLSLNIMQRMSGIATETNKYTEQLKGLKTKVIDTRKTTPGMRYLEKLAVMTGGGGNHRMGLYDMILVKDNHIDFAGGIEQAITKVKKYLKEKNKDLKIEVEARSLDNVKDILRVGGVDRIMFDNFTPAQTKEAVKVVNGATETESSGGITINDLRAYGECGVDFISVGALTHQIKSLDLSLKAIDF